MRARHLTAVAIQNQRVVRQVKAQTRRRLMLQRFDRIVGELFDPAAVHTHHMVMMLTPVQLEHRRTALKVVAGDEAGSLKLGQDPIDRGQTDVLIGFQQAAVNVLGREVMSGFNGQNVEDLDARRRDLQARFAQILAFHSVLPRSGMISPHYPPRDAGDNPRRRDFTMPAPKTLLAAALTLGLALGGCVYKVNIPQGNYIEAKYLDQVNVGMTRSQVRYLLGTPMLSDPFHPERWDYVYYFKTGKTQKVDQRNITIWFAEDKVTKIDRPPGAWKDPIAQRPSI